MPKKYCYITLPCPYGHPDAKNKKCRNGLTFQVPALTRDSLAFKNDVCWRFASHIFSVHGGSWAQCMEEAIDAVQLADIWEQEGEDDEDSARSRSPRRISTHDLHGESSNSVGGGH